LFEISQKATETGNGHGMEKMLGLRSHAKVYVRT